MTSYILTQFERALDELPEKVAMVEKRRSKDLKGPDKFQTNIYRLLDWAEKNVKQILLVLVPIVVLVLAGVAWQFLGTMNADKRIAELGEIIAKYDAEEEAAQKERDAIQKQISELDAQISKAATPADGQAEAKPADPALTERKTALEKQRDEIKADHSESLASFESFFKENHSNAEGFRAAMTAAKIYLERQSYDKAQETLQSLLANSIDNQFYQIYARLVYINVLEELGSYDEALKQIETLSGLAGDDLKPKVLLVKGRIEMMKDAKEEAKQTLQKLIEEHGATPEAQKARSMQALIN